MPTLEALQREQDRAQLYLGLLVLIRDGSTQCDFHNTQSRILKSYGVASWGHLHDVGPLASSLFTTFMD